MSACASAGADGSGVPEWIRARRQKATQWIWPDGVHALGKRTHVSGGRRKFRHAFDVRDPGSLESAVLRVASFTGFSAILNGKDGRSGRNWQAATVPEKWHPARELGDAGGNHWKTEPDPSRSGPLPVFRKAFGLDGQPIDAARVTICGLVHFDLSIDGQKVGDRVLDPPWSDYADTCYSVAFDVSNMLRPGENVIGVMLGNGMFNVRGGRIVPATSPPIAVIRHLRPVSVTRLPDGRYEVDLGESLSCRPTLSVTGKRGSRVTVEMAEVRGKPWPGHSYTYTLKGALEPESFVPRFTYFSFQYLYISGATWGTDVADADDQPAPVETRIRLPMAAS